jgi:ribosome-associated protein
VLSTEGEDNGEWIIVDCGAAVAHIMQPAIRDYYHLEEIWGGKAVRMKVAAADGRLVKASEPDAPARKSASRTAAKGSATAALKSAAKTAAKTVSSRAPAKKAAAKKAANQAAAFKRVAAKAPARKAPAAKRPAARKVATRAPRAAKT